MRSRYVTPKWIGAALAAMTLVTSAADAAAYCRTTTCDPRLEEGCRRNAEGCVRDGAALRWTTTPILYRFDAAGSEKLDNAKAKEVVRRAFDTWSNVTCDDRRTSLRFEEGSEIRASKPLHAVSAREPFGIYFRDDSWTHDDDEGSLALTTQIYGKITGAIDYADIEINTATTRFSLRSGEEGIDLQSVVTHEVGHYIGLAHSPEQGSIMAARYCESDDRCSGSIDEVRALSDDDITAVCNLYPPAKSGGKADDRMGPPSAGCAVGAGSSEGAASIAFGLLVLLSVGFVRRNRGVVGWR